MAVCMAEVWMREWAWVVGRARGGAGSGAGKNKSEERRRRGVGAASLDLPIFFFSLARRSSLVPPRFLSRRPWTLLPRPTLLSPYTFLLLS